jgi:hypothetical protein
MGFTLLPAVQPYLGYPAEASDRQAATYTLSGLA